MASFQAKIGWKMPRKSGKKNGSDEFLTRSRIENSKKKQKKIQKN